MMDCVCVRLDSDDMAMTMNVMSHVDVFEQESTVCWTPRDPHMWRFGYVLVTPVFGCLIRQVHDLIVESQG